MAISAHICRRLPGMLQELHQWYSWLLLLCWTLLILSSSTFGGTHFSYGLHVAHTSTVSCCFFLIISVFRSYKINFFNIIDCLEFAIITLTNFLIVYATRVSSFPIQLLYFMAVIPFLYFTLILYKIFEWHCFPLVAAGSWKCFKQEIKTSTRTFKAIINCHIWLLQSV